MPESKKKAGSRKTKSKGKTRAKSRPTPSSPATSGNPIVLTKEQEFYIEGNMEILTESQIAADLKLPVELVHAYIVGLPKNTGKSRASALMQRPARGVVAMTEAASMAADDFKQGGMITQAEINQAAANGNYKLAAELAEQKKTQKTTATAQQAAKYGHCCHFIRPPGYEPPVTDKKDKR